MLTLRFASVALLLITASVLHAGTVALTGQIERDDQVIVFTFNVSSLSNVVVRTWSFAGGTNSLGQNIAPGGFDPNLALFDGMQLILDQNDDGPSGLVSTDPVTGKAYDAYIADMLAPGRYYLALSQFQNFAIGPTLDDGFTKSGQPNYTGTACGSPTGRFYEIERCAQRTGAWAVELINVDTAAVVPEPSTGALLAVSLGALLARVRRRKVRAWNRVPLH